MRASSSPGSCGRAAGSPAALPHAGFRLVIRRQSRVTGQQPWAGTLLTGNCALLWALPGYIWDYRDSGKDEDGGRHITSSKMWHGVGSGVCRSDPSSANLSNLPPPPLPIFFFLEQVKSFGQTQRGCGVSKLCRAGNRAARLTWGTSLGTLEG